MDWGLLKTIIESYGTSVSILFVLLWVVFLTFMKIKPNKAEKDLIDTLINRVKCLECQVRDLNIKIDEQHNEISDLLIRNKELEVRLRLMESTHLDNPLPQWIKDTQGIMVSLNKAYEDSFLIPLGFEEKDYLGKTDKEVWGEDIGEQYLSNDRMVLASGRMWYGVEDVLTPHGNRVPHLIVKYPRYSGRAITGIAGVAVPDHMARVLIEARG